MELTEILTLMIAYSGESTSSSMEAIALAQQGALAEADTQMEQAAQALGKAHEAHMDLLVREANGEKLEITLLLIHASNHMSSAEMIHNVAKCFIKQYRKGERTW